jgi:hypothetical protein
VWQLDGDLEEGSRSGVTIVVGTMLVLMGVAMGQVVGMPIYAAVGGFE